MVLNTISINKKDVALILLITFFVILIRTAWIGDDAIFTFRSILNFLSGYGPNFNFSERVQSFTHPLWFLLLSAVTLITKNPFTAAYISSISISIILFWLLLTNQKANIFGIILAGSGLLLSKAFIDYSTSGLENPLTNLLLLLTIFSFNKAVLEKNFQSILFFFACISFTYLCRSDAIIFIFPMICVITYKFRNHLRKILPAAFLGSLPFLIWSIFSFLYYGSIFPNTAYAKLNTGIPLEQMLLQGLMYYINSIGVDPITLSFIVLGAFFGLTQTNNRPIAFGIILYLLYIVLIGGDFMSGRFFSAPMLLSAYILSTSSYSKRSMLMVMSIVLILGTVGIKHTLLSDHTYGSRDIPISGITDERAYYFDGSGLLNLSRQNFEPIHWPKNMTQNGNPKVLCSPALTTMDHSLPIDSHFIIYCALADPLLSRLPISLRDGWRVGHYNRLLPDGYKESIATDSNQIKDLVLHPIYDAISKVTRGSLWDSDRLKTILEFNFTDKFNPTKSFLKKGIQFNQEPLSYFVIEAQGFSAKEDWGRWSDTAQNQAIQLDLLVLLPKKFTLVIDAKGFAQNVGQLATIVIGDSKKTILLEKEIKRYEIPFSLSERTSLIKIIPPSPISPNEVDSSNQDRRKLGIGIQSIAFIE